MENGGAPQAEKAERQVNDIGQIEVEDTPFRMASLDRVSKLPVVKETVKMVNNLYGKVKVSNNVVSSDQVLVLNATLFYWTVLCVYSPVLS